VLILVELRGHPKDLPLLAAQPFPEPANDVPVAADHDIHLAVMRVAVRNLSAPHPLTPGREFVLLRLKVGEPFGELFGELFYAVLACTLVTPRCAAETGLWSGETRAVSGLCHARRRSSH
jgi:hypothetical protein